MADEKIAWVQREAGFAQGEDGPSMALFKKDKWAAGGQASDLTSAGKPVLLTHDDARNVAYKRARNALVSHIELGAMLAETEDAAAQHRKLAGEVSLLPDDTAFERELSLSDGTSMHFWLLPTAEARRRGAVWQYLNMRTGRPGEEQI